MGSTSDNQTETAVIGPASVESMVESFPIGANAGRYVVLEEAGRGAMGRVLRAYDPKLHREVALKELQSDAADPRDTGRAQVIAEARAMAQLSHPNVVAVYDVESLDANRMAVVMEYVAGTTLRSWLREEQRPWPEVVARFIDAGRGLAAAHEAGMLHRDFKPANVLIADRVVKVTDFGLAEFEATVTRHQGLSAEVSSSSIVGTPRYMAPEQHQGDVLTTAADQYAFCVALWEAVIGQSPFFGRMPLEQKLEGPPPWPDPAVPRPIAEAIRRGLAVEPQERWPTMDALLDALAYDPARRRNRWLLAIGGLAMIGLSVATWRSRSAARIEQCSGASQQLAGVWDDARSAEVEAAIVGIGASYATGVWQRTRARLDRYKADWSAMYTQACMATIQGEQSTSMLDRRMGCMHRVMLRLRAATDVLADADADVVRKADELLEDLPALSRCADLEALQAEVEPPAGAEVEPVEGIRTLLADARAKRAAGRYDAAQVNVDAAKGRLDELEYEPIRTEIALEDGYVLDHRGRYDAAEAALREVLGLGSRWHQWELVHEAASKLVHVVGVRKQQMDEGLRYREIAEGLAAGHPSREARLHSSLGSLRLAKGQYTEATAEYREALALWEQVQGTVHPSVATARSSLAVALKAQGNYTEAEAEQRRALAILEAALGSDHPSVALSQTALASVLKAQHRYVEAEAEQRQALAVYERALGADHPSVAGARNNLANVFTAQNKLAEAEAEHRRALEVRVRTLGADHPLVAISHNNLAHILMIQKRYAKAEVETRLALQGLEKALGPDHPHVATTHNNLAATIMGQGRLAEAEIEYRAALAGYERALGADHRDLFLPQSNLANTLFELGRTDEALELAEQIWPRHDEMAPDVEARTAFVIARVLGASEPDADQRARARAMAQRALETYLQAEERYAAEVAAVREWLARHPQ